MARRFQPDCTFPPARISRMTKTIKGSVVVITGATGAIAQALIAELTARGAAKIYTAARDISALAASGPLVPIKMDVTSDDDVTSAAAVATDVTLLINNAGAVLNMLTILARVTLPFMGSYCASKAAGLSLTQGLRGELGPKGVRVAAALPGAVDTRMTAGLPIPKMSPADAAREILDGFESGEE